MNRVIKSGSMFLRARLFVIGITTALCAVALASCGGSGSTCTPDKETCGAGLGCVVGVCRKVDEPLVKLTTTRVVLPARRVAVLSSGDQAETSTVTALGASASGDVIVLMAFESDVGARVSVKGAFLVLDPEPASPGPTEAIDVEVTPVLSKWEEGPLSWGRVPTLGSRLGSARIMPARRAPLRIEVTHHVERLRGVGYGLALRASGDDPIGARFVTASGTTTGPRLELYLE